MLGLGLRRRLKSHWKRWFRGTSETPVATAPVATTPPSVPEPSPPVSETAAPPPTPLVSPITPEAVERLFDEMIRPGLQMDGGDIALVKIENNDIYVRLVGSCSSCPSSIMTLRMGVERLLQEEFPMMGALIPVDELAVA